eukprot:7767621-Pyramimonas_sp.AAC.1
MCPPITTPTKGWQSRTMTNLLARDSQGMISSSIPSHTWQAGKTSIRYVCARGRLRGASPAASKEGPGGGGVHG